MDDLTLLRNFQSDTPGPTPAETASARARLLTAIDAPPASARTTASWRLRDTARRLGRPRFWAPAAAAAAVTAVAVTAALLAGPGARVSESSGHQPVNGPALLREAAAAAARQAPGRGPFFATQLEILDPQGYPPSIRAAWTGHRDRVAFGNRSLTWTQFQSLPTTPGPLLADIATVSVPVIPASRLSLEASEFAVISDLLAKAPAPPALRSALYQVAAGLPGVRLIRHAHDLIGRSAAEAYLSFRNVPNGGQALYFNPSTGAVLDVATFGPSPQCPADAEIAVLVSGYVSADRQLPPGALRTPRPVTQPTVITGCFTDPTPEVPPSPFPG
ncbi:MAG TPA: hypothetical protein VHY31_25650 [Streptosporangiaceae bacterium]|jgi:hypothetical protein|nr:hypothetical protein [Streptosporangiaceae bacterium]